jgi:hypothetical protein
MKRLTTMAAVFVLTLSLTAFAFQAPPPAGPAGQQPPAAAAEKNYSGQLAKVDDKAKEITLKGTDNKEMMFTWDDKTQITGVEGPQGLTGKTGSALKVTYREAAGRNLATKIEVAAAK